MSDLGNPSLSISGPSIPTLAFCGVHVYIHYVLMYVNTHMHDLRTCVCKHTILCMYIYIYIYNYSLVYIYYVYVLCMYVHNIYIYIMYIYVFMYVCTYYI